MPLKVTRKLNNPVEFYEDSFNFDNEYSEADFGGIVISGVCHQELLMSFSGNRPIGINKELHYFLSFNEWDYEKGKLIFKSINI